MLYFCSIGSSTEERAYTQSSLRTTRECPVVVFRLRNVTQGRIVSIFFSFNSIDNGSLMRNPCFSNVCVCAVPPPPQDGWRIACHFFPHSRPSIHPKPHLVVWGSCPLRSAHEGHRTAQQHKSRRTIMNYLWSDITQAGRRCRCVGVCPTNSCFPGILAVSSTWCSS